jgi:protein gp37
MGDKTGISWTDATWNPIRGCTRVSPGCVNCYAEAVASNPRLGGPGKPYEGLTDEKGRWNGNLRLAGDMLSKPFNWKRPRKIFVNSMSDLFHEKAPYHFQAAIFSAMREAHWHTFQVLTKRAHLMANVVNKWMVEFNNGKALPNVWLGVSAEDDKRAEERIPQLACLLDAANWVKWVSYEPALENVNWSRFTGRIDWLVAGGESGTNARAAQTRWFRAAYDFSRSRGGPAFFFKQTGRELARLYELKARRAGDDIEELRAHPQFADFAAQEFPLKKMEAA